mgnify:CR=1 FL=1
MVRNMHAGLFAFESDRGMEDYVYNADDLRNLTGRRYQPKRNHINRFMAEYPDFRYEQLTRERFGAVHAARTRMAPGPRRAHLGTVRRTAGHAAGFRTFRRSMEMIGGCIYVGDKLIAFTYGSAVNDHTFDTHVEKADTDYDGAFTIINKLFGTAPSRAFHDDKPRGRPRDRRVAPVEALLPPAVISTNMRPSTCTRTKSPARNFGRRHSATTNNSSTRS